MLFRSLKAEDAATRERLAAILWEGLEAVRIVAVGLLPVMPETAARALRAMGVEPPASLDALAWGGLPAAVPIPEHEALFPRIDKDTYFAGTTPAAASAPPPATAAAPAKPKEPAVPQITIDDFMGVELKVARVKAAEEVPKSSKLVKLTVDLGGEQRTLVAGIRKAYAPEQLVGKQVIVVANLQPATLMGVESNGMVLAASIDGEPSLLAVDPSVPAGTKVK